MMTDSRQLDYQTTNLHSLPGFEGVGMDNGVGIIISLGLGLTCFAAWLQHLYTCFNEGMWGFLIAGAIFFPVAVVHGVGIWFGFWH